MRNMMLAAAFLGALALGTSQASAQTGLRCARFGEPPVPEPRSYSGAVARNEAIDEEAKLPHRILFLGDSLFERWDPESWQTHYAARGALNAGVSGDRTQNLLWRVENGNLVGPPPQLVVLMIGTNDLGLGRTPEDTAEGVRAILAALRARLPRVPILLLGIWPRAMWPKAPLRGEIAEVNRLIRGCTDGVTIRYLDLGGLLLDPDGRLSPAVSPDRLHLSALGYARLMPQLDSAIDRLLAPDR